jgi:hypothetical protein
MTGLNEVSMQAKGYDPVGTDASAHKIANSDSYHPHIPLSVNFSVSFAGIIRRVTPNNQEEHAEERASDKERQRMISRENMICVKR